MTAVDLPPGLPLPGLPAGEFESRPGQRRLARVVWWLVLLCAIATFAIASRHVFSPVAEVAMGMALMSSSLAFMGLAVRRARIQISRDGIRWGWDLVGFRMQPERMRGIHLYRDALALVPQRGSTWFISARDWDRFEGVPAALADAGISFETFERKAPFRARLQSYGRVLNGLLVFDVFLAALGVATAIGG